MKRNWLGITFAGLLMLVTLLLFAGMFIVGVNFVSLAIILVVGVSSGILFKLSW